MEIFQRCELQGSTPEPVTGVKLHLSMAAGSAQADARVSAYGDVDELNSVLGLARVELDVIRS
jgi:hypothetical protein